MKRRVIWAVFIVITALLIGVFVFIRAKQAVPVFTAAPNQVVDLKFELDKKLEFGEYYFDLDNGTAATYPLCYCLTENNSFPPNCNGDVKYIYHVVPGDRCVPLNIGKGRCGIAIMSSASFATLFIIPLEYSWTKPFETIHLGIRVPPTAPNNSRLNVLVTLFKRTTKGNLVPYRKYNQYIDVRYPAK